MAAIGRNRRRPLAPMEAFRASGRPAEGRREEAGGLLRADGWLLACIAALCAFGLVVVYSASDALGYLWFGNSDYFFVRQVLGLALGGMLMVAAARIDYHRWRDWSKAIATVTILMLLLVLVPHIGSERYGARRWFDLGPLSLQPSAVATLMFVVCMSRWLADRAPRLHRLATVRDYAILLAVLLGLILLEKDLGSTAVLAGIALVMLALAGARKRHLGALAASVAALGLFAIKAAHYRAARLSSFLNPFADPLGAGWQAVQSQYALGSGGLTGVGLGHSIEKYQWLPEAHTDFIFAIIGEELGLIGTLGVVAAFLYLAWRGVRAAHQAPDMYGALLAGGTTSWICIQAFVNIGAVIGVVPTTGLPLPFISYGGSSLAMTLLAAGILCNVSAQGRRQGAEKRAHVDRWRRHGWAPEPGPGRRGGVAAL